VSQTDGKVLPELSERVTGNVGEYRERLVDFVIAQGIKLESAISAQRPEKVKLPFRELVSAESLLFALLRLQF